MRIAETATTVLVLLALTMQYFRIPFGGVLFLLSITALAIVYYPLGVFIFKINGEASAEVQSVDRKKSWKQKLVGLAVGAALAISLIGILFKIQLWPNGDFFLKVGVGFVVLTIAASSFFYFQRQSLLAKKVLRRCLLWGGIGLMVFLISNDTLIDHFYSERSEEYRELTKEYYRDSSNKELHEKRMRMDEEYYSREFE
jgi:hypothetical protein